MLLTDLEEETIVSTHHHPIVQVELHSWGKTADLLPSLCGASTKLTFRMFDQDGELELVIRRAAAAAQAQYAVLELTRLYPGHPIPKDSPLQWLSSPLDSLLHLKNILHAKAVSMVKERIANATSKELPIAMENRDRTFRPAKASEVQVAVEFAKTAKAANLFLFPPNELLADKHESSIHSMV